MNGTGTQDTQSGSNLIAHVDHSDDTHVDVPHEVVPDSPRDCLGVEQAPVASPSEVLKTLSTAQRGELSGRGSLLGDETIGALDEVRGRKVDLFEICAPWDSPLSAMVVRYGGSAMRLGVHNGFDLSTKGGFHRAVQELREHRPRKVHFSPPCFPWSRMQNLNQRTPAQCAQLEEKRNRSRRILRNLERLCEIQVLELHGDKSGEQPWAADTWSESPWARMTHRAGGRFRVDGCMFDMRHPQTGLFLQKGWGFFSSDPTLRKVLAKTCNHAASSHTPIEGSVTASTATYPSELCRSFAKAILDRDREFDEISRAVFFHQQSMRDQTSCEGAFASDAVPEGGICVESPAPEASPEPVGPVSDSHAHLLQRLRVIHKNLGHPSQIVLQRMLRQAGVSDEVLQLAGQLECDVCKRHAQRRPVLPTAILAPVQKWEVVSADTFWWKHPAPHEDGTERFTVGVSFMDEATDLHVACIVRESERMPASVTMEESKRAFCDCWLRHFPKPKKFRSDVEGCFYGHDFVTWLGEQMIQFVPSAGEAYWQVGKHSRHLHTVKTQMSKLAEDADGPSEPREILALCLAAKNEMHAIKGYSPNQWAFGQNSDRLYSSLQTHEHLPVSQSQDPTFLESIRTMARARELFIQCDSYRRLLRASELKSRRMQEYKMGDLVYYYRKGKRHGQKIRGQWYGPARVLFLEKTTEHDRGYAGSVVWLAHGVVLLRCAPEQLQPVSRDLFQLDRDLNGPFNPGAFVKSKEKFQDLLVEHDDLEHEALEEEDTAWKHDPNDMEMRPEADERQVMPGPARRVRLVGKQGFKSQDLDRVAGLPSHEPGVPREDGAGEGRPVDGGPRDPGHDATIRTRPDDAAKELEVRRQDVYRDVGAGTGLRPLGGQQVRRPEDRAEGVAPFRQVPGAADRVPGEVDGPSSETGRGQEHEQESPDYQPVRGREDRRLRQQRWLELHRREGRGTIDLDISSDDEDPAAGGDNGPDDPGPGHDHAAPERSRDGHQSGKAQSTGP